MEGNDLRTSLELLKKMKGQLVETDIEVDPAAELAGVYRHVGAGGTVMRPTKIDGPAMLFHNIKNHKGAKVLIGLLASRESLLIVGRHSHRSDVGVESVRADAVNEIAFIFFRLACGLLLNFSGQTHHIVGIVRVEPVREHFG